jgi:hypothetical protein
MRSGPKRARVTELLDAVVGCEAGVGERGQFSGLQTLVHLDEIPGGNRHELRVTAVGSEARPASVAANLGVAFLAVTAGAIAPAADHDHLIPILETNRPTQARGCQSYGPHRRFHGRA